MNGPYILLVDDDAALLQALPHMMALRIHGVRVDTAGSAIEALKLIQTCDYDAIISDIMMPGMDGLELLTRIKELRPSTPTLLITGNVDPSLIAQAMKLGAYDFIQKPIDRLLLLAALHRAVQTRQLQRQVQRQERSLHSYAERFGPIESAPRSPAPQMQPGDPKFTPFQPPRWLV